MSLNKWVFLVLLVFVSGCATVRCGKSVVRFSLVDIDLRDKDQIAASAAADNGQTVATAKGVSGWWDVVVEILGAIKGRVRVLSYESVCCSPCCTNSVKPAVAAVPSDNGSGATNLEHSVGK
jgi:hypothetical protein